MPKIIFVFLTGLFLLLFGCAGTGKTQQSDKSRDAAYDALDAMDRARAGEPLTMPGAGGQPDSSGVNSAGAGTQGTNSAGNGTAGAGQPAPGTAAGQQQQTAPGAISGEMPAWVDSPDKVYSRQRYVSAVGFGSDRLQAERSALANLTGVFGQSVQAELKTTSTYSEAVMSGVIQVTENSSVHDAITTSMEMDTLIGAQTADVWFDGRSTWYAAAIMEKEKSAVLYADLIRSNERIIEDLTSVTGDQKNSLGGYSRFMLAAAIADANRVYANVLTLVGNTSGINPGAMKKGDDYRIEAADIAKNIPIAVSAEGDRSNRIRNAFSRALSSAGFRSGGTDSRYALKAELTMTEAVLPNQPNIFVRYIVDASLVDNSDNSVLFPFSFNGREGHVNRTEAEERALRAAETKITGEYPNYLRDGLSLLLPR
ncbi:MAG: LPP20 family lipoprotein [Treponema sp.]|nr:LPP20 family lipoprotein [Treponema sp.]